MSEAEDAVQESYARWYEMSRQQQEAIQSPGAWLTTVASRICLRRRHGKQIAHAWAEIANRAAGTMTFAERTVNGQPGVVSLHDGVTVTVFAFDVAGDRIKHIWVIRNPDKLRPWTKPVS